MGSLYFEKQPKETFFIAADFSERLAAGETILTATVSAVIAGTTTDVTTTIISSSSISGDNVNVKVKAGSSGSSYKITVLANTSSSSIYELDILMRVVEE